MTPSCPRSLKILFPIALVCLALTACAQRPGPRAGGQTAVPAPPASAPLGATLGTPGEAALPPGSEPWRDLGVSRTEYRADVESCYAYSQAQIAHDERIEADSGAAFDAFPSGLGMAALSSRMNQFERKNRRGSLYSECMRAKGYSRQ